MMSHYTGDVQPPSEDQSAPFGRRRWTGPAIEDALAQARQQLQAEQERLTRELEADVVAQAERHWQALSDLEAAHRAHVERESRRQQALEAIHNQHQAVDRQMKAQIASLSKER
jgi:hypothetical protein